MKINKDELFVNALTYSLIVFSPFIGTYCGIKWIVKQICNNTPKRKKEIKEQIQEIHRLEEQLGFHYDPYYYKNSEQDNKAYLEDLREKARNNYKIPNIIVVIIEEGEDLCTQESDRDCSVALLVHKNYIPIEDYEINGEPADRKGLLFLGSKWGGDKYFNFFYHVLSCSSNHYGSLTTLSECGCYADYYIVHVPGEFQYKEVINGDDKVEAFIDNLKKKYIKHTD